MVQGLTVEEILVIAATQLVHWGVRDFEVKSPEAYRALEHSLGSRCHKENDRIVITAPNGLVFISNE